MLSYVMKNARVDGCEPRRRQWRFQEERWSEEAATQLRNWYEPGVCRGWLIVLKYCPLWLREIRFQRVYFLSHNEFTFYFPDIYWTPALDVGETRP